MELPPLGVCYDEATVRLARWSRGALVASPAVFPVAARFPAGPYRVSEFPDGALVQLDVADPGDGVFLHGPSAVSRCGAPDAGLGIQLEPRPQPLRHCVFFRAGDVQLPVLCNLHG